MHLLVAAPPFAAFGPLPQFEKEEKTGTSVSSFVESGHFASASRRSLRLPILGFRARFSSFGPFSIP
jgi:hypothetical protein